MLEIEECNKDKLMYIPLTPVRKDKTYVLSFYGLIYVNSASLEAGERIISEKDFRKVLRQSGVKDSRTITKAINTFLT